jgi:proline dehydrogenase
MDPVSAGLRSGLLRASRSAALRRRLPRVPFIRRAVSRFMPGESLAEALDACQALGAHGIGSVVTLLGEDTARAEDARAAVAHYAGVLEEIARRGLDTELSVKPTHLGLGVSAELAAAGLEEIAGRAAARARCLWVDMEGSAHSQGTLDLYRRVRAVRPNAGLCVQAYLRRTAADLESLLAAAAGEPRLRLVKGAYAEPRSIAFASKSEVDANYVALAERMLEAAGGGAGRLAFATHDLAAIRHLGRLAAARGIPRTAFEFQMLYGIQREAQLRLAAEGYRVRVLISYGPEWFPWYMRRLAERPANLWFVLRSIARR